MDIKQLKIFCTVIEKRGFSLAAKTLDLTQPTVSFQIASLEEELGTKLLDRGGRATTPTKSGDILYRYALQILELVHEAEQSIHSLEGLFWGEVSLGASNIPGEYILPEMLQKFRASHPGIEINLSIDDTSGIIRKVLDNEVELGVVGATEKNEKLTFTPFFTDRLVLMVPAQNEWFAHDSATMSELIKAPFIMREGGSGTRMVMEAKLKEADVCADDLNIVMTLGSTAAVKRAVESGAGVSIMSERAVRNEMKLGLIRLMAIEGLELVRDFFIVHRKQKVLSPAAEAMLQFLKQTR